MVWMLGIIKNNSQICGPPNFEWPKSNPPRVHFISSRSNSLTPPALQPCCALVFFQLLQWPPVLLAGFTKKNEWRIVTFNHLNRLNPPPILVHVGFQVRMLIVGLQSSFTNWHKLTFTSENGPTTPDHVIGPAVGGSDLSCKAFYPTKLQHMSAQKPRTTSNWWSFDVKFSRFRSFQMLNT